LSVASILWTVALPAEKSSRPRRASGRRSRASCSPQLEDLERPARQLRDEAIVHALVALALDHDRGVLLVGGDGHRVRLPGERDAPDDRVAGDVDDDQLAGRRGEVTATSAQRPTTATLVESPPTSRMPSGSGAWGRRRSTKPMRPVGASVL
jgi:hypothetical protein